MIAAVLLGLSLLLLSRRREFMTATATIKDPSTWTDEDYNQFKERFPDIYSKFKENVGPAAEFEIGRLIAVAWYKLYQPAATRLTTGDIDTFIAQNPGPPGSQDLEKSALNAYFETEEGPARNTMSPTLTAQQDGVLSEIYGRRLRARLGGSTVAMGRPPGFGEDSDLGTGGSSTSSAPPTSGGGPSRRVWGPEYPGMGAGGGDGAEDTTGSRMYPELVGPGGDISTMYPGAGVGAPSKSWQLSMNGSLPSFDSLGATELSKYLPFSRVPGDKDLIPNPYSISSTYTTSNYSSKTEPVPFLTDFSAFQK